MNLREKGRRELYLSAEAMWLTANKLRVLWQQHQCLLHTLRKVWLALAALGSHQDRAGDDLSGW